MASSTSARKTPQKGRLWVANHVALLNDPDIGSCSDAARLLLHLALMWAGQQGNDGRIPTNPKKVDFFAHLDGGAASAASALQELADVDFLVLDETDPNFYVIRNWDKFQADFGGSTTRSASNSAGTFRVNHNKGKHTTPVAGCPICEGLETPPPAGPVAPVVQLVPAAVEAEPVVESAPVVEVSEVADDKPAKRTLKAFIADVNDALTEHMQTAPSAFVGYTDFLAQADELAGYAADLSKDPGKAIRDAIVAHAIVNLVDERVTFAELPQAFRAIKALGADGHRWWIAACVEVAGKEFENPAGAVRYLTTVAKSQRSKYAA